MALPFGTNWACNLVRDQMQSGASAEEIANLLAKSPEFIAAVRTGIESDQPDVPGGDGAEHAVANLIDALQVTNW